MLHILNRNLLCLIIGLPLCAASMARAEFRDDFSKAGKQWDAFQGNHPWKVQDGQLRPTQSNGDLTCLLNEPIASDAMVQTLVKLHGEGGRRNFGVILRAKDARHYLMVRYYDREDALQLLTHGATGFASDQPLSAPVHLDPNRTQHLKVAVVGDRLLAKIWPEGDGEPRWQFEQRVSETEPGRFGLGVHDSSRVGFDSFSLQTEHDEIKAIRNEIEAEKQKRLQHLRDHLKLQIEASPLPCPHDRTRRVDVVTLIGQERAAVNGTVYVDCDDYHERRPMTTETHPTGMLVLRLPEPDQKQTVRVTFEADEGVTVKASMDLSPASEPQWSDYVRACLDTLLEKGTDHYGPVKTAMLMSILDVYTHQAPQQPQLLDAEIRTEGRPTHGRLSPGGSNLWLDMPTIKALYLASQRTGDSKYAQAADAYIADTYKHAAKSNGLLAWGSHSYYDAFRDKPGGDVHDGQPVHEILIKHADWEAMYRIDPKAFHRFVDGLWKWHIVDKKTGLHNRHDDGHVGCDFAFSGGSFAMACAALAKFTEEEDYRDKARLVASWHYENRNRKTGLTADCPNLKNRYDGHHCFTTVSGPHAAALLKCFELTGDRYFREAALTYIKAYDTYGWDKQAGTYCGMVTLDGRCVPEQKRGAGYDIWKPTGHVDVWRTTMYSYEMPLIAAQTAVYACNLADTDDDRQAMLRSAQRWAKVIRDQLPPKPGRRWNEELHAALPQLESTGGTYAENYGRAIAFFAGLHEITGDKKDLETAETLAREAVHKLYVNGIFRGHPAKPYYQSNEGVGYLLLALMQLDRQTRELALAF